MYYYQFLISSEDEDFAHSVENVLESVDIIHFNQDENYDESVIMRNEINILELLIDIIKENNVDEGVVKKVKNWSELFLIKWNF